MNIMITIISRLTCKSLSSHGIVVIVLISNNFQYSCTYTSLLFYCDLSYTILNIRLYTIANITLHSYITIRMLPILIHPEINCSVLYLISCMIFVTLFLYWQVPYSMGHNPYGSNECKINWMNWMLIFVNINVNSAAGHYRMYLRDWI